MAAATASRAHHARPARVTVITAATAYPPAAHAPHQWSSPGPLNKATPAAYTANPAYHMARPRPGIVTTPFLM